MCQTILNEPGGKTFVIVVQVPCVRINNWNQVYAWAIKGCHNLFTVIYRVISLKVKCSVLNRERIPLTLIYNVKNKTCLTLIYNVKNKTWLILIYNVKNKTII